MATRWIDPPVAAGQLRTMLGALAAWIAAGGHATNGVNYPDIDTENDTTFPRCVMDVQSSSPSVGTGLTLRQDEIAVEFHAFGRYEGTILTADTGTNTFTLSGDQTSLVAANDDLAIVGSTGNDQWYTIASVALNGSDTDVVVDQDISDATADGSAYWGSLERWVDEISTGLAESLTGLNIKEANRTGVERWTTPGQDQPSMYLRYLMCTLTIRAGSEI